MNSLQIAHYSNWAEVLHLKEQWNLLAQPDSTSGSLLPSIFQTFEWHECWWKHFSENHELLILVVSDQTGVILIAPFMIIKAKGLFKRKTLRFIGNENYASDYAGFVQKSSQPEAIKLVLGWLDLNKSRWNQLDLSHLPESSEALEKIIQYATSYKFISKKSYFCDAPTRILNNEKENQELINKKSLKRHFNWFKNQGELTFGHIEAENAILARIEDFFEQHIGRRSIASEPSQFLNENQRSFYKDLVKTFLPQGALRFFTVDLNGKSVAYHVGFVYGAKFYWYKPSFDIQYLKKSPGEVLLKTLFEYSIDQNLTEFDFTAGNEAFKYRFSNEVRRLYRLEVYKNRYIQISAFTLSFALRAFRKLGSLAQIRQKKKFEET